MRETFFCNLYQLADYTSQVIAVQEKWTQGVPEHSCTVLPCHFIESFYRKRMHAHMWLLNYKHFLTTQLTCTEDLQLASQPSTVHACRKMVQLSLSVYTIVTIHVQTDKYGYTILLHAHTVLGWLASYIQLEVWGKYIASQLDMQGFKPTL